MGEGMSLHPIPHLSSRPPTNPWVPHAPCVCSVPESETPVDTNLIELDTK